jgi:hypothetical protein
MHRRIIFIHFGIIFIIIIIIIPCGFLLTPTTPAVALLLNT